MTERNCPRCNGLFEREEWHDLGDGYQCTGCDAYFSVWYIEDVGWEAALETLRQRQRVYRVPLFQEA